MAFASATKFSILRQARVLCCVGQNTTSRHAVISFQQSRGARQRRGTGIHSDPSKRDEILLKRLEAQLKNVKVKIQREEEEAAEMMKQYRHRGPNTTDPPHHNFYFWEKVLSNEDRKELAMNEIHSMEQLNAVHEEALKVMNKVSNPDTLSPRLRLGFNMYESIPAKIAEAGRRKARPWFSEIL